MDDIQKDLYDLNFSDTFTISNNEKQNIDLSLETTSQGSTTITGQVLDSNNIPVENATIKLFDEKGLPFIHTVTDNNGIYTLSGLLKGNYSISCVKKRFRFNSSK